MSTDKSLIMINGRRVANEADASGLGNAMALDRINLSNVERVEIVRAFLKCSLWLGSDGRRDKYYYKAKYENISCYWIGTDFK